MAVLEVITVMLQVGISRLDHLIAYNSIQVDRNRRRTDQMMSQKLVLIDGHSILNRAFYGVPESEQCGRDCTQMPVYGFLNIMFKILEEEKPDYLAVAFDVHAPTFRHQDVSGV